MCLAALLFAVVAGDLSAPKVELHFPPPDALTDAPTVTITGAAHDASGVAGVRVNGVDATSVDGFAHWRAPIPLVLGTNDVVVETWDVLGNRDLQAARSSVRFEGPFLTAVTAVFDGAKEGTTLAVDDAWRGIIEIERATGLRRNVAWYGDGSKPRFTRIAGIAVSGGADRVFVVADSAQPPTSGGLFELDLQSGQRKLLSGGSVGSGPILFHALGAFWDAASGRVLTIRGVDPTSLIAIDPASGVRTEISGTSHSGPALHSVQAAAFEVGRRRVLVFEHVVNQFIAIDVATGARTVLSGGGVGSGPSVISVTGTMTVDEAHDVLFVRTDASSLLTVDLTTGDRKMLFTQLWLPEGQYPYVGSPSFAWDPARQEAFISNGRTFETLDLGTGEHRPLLSPRRGGGVPITEANRMCLDEAGRHLLVVRGDTSRQTLVSVSIATGDRTPLGVLGDFCFQSRITLDPQGQLWGEAIGAGGHHSTLDYLGTVDPATGASRLGPVTESSYKLTGGSDVDFALDRVYLDRGTYVEALGFDGSRAWISGLGLGSGPVYSGGGDLVLEAGARSLLSIQHSSKSLMRVDLGSGDRTVLSDSVTGSGPSLTTPATLRLSPFDGHALWFSTWLRSLISVDLATGERTSLSVDHLTDPLHPSGAGPAFDVALDFVVDAERRVAYVVERGEERGPLAVELQSGDRVLVSR